MTRRVRLDGRLVLLEPEMLLGTGGEAEVYREGERAIKLFHNLDTLAQLNPGVSPAALKARLAEKRDKIDRFPDGLPSAVVAPLAPVFDGREIAGYAMPLVRGAHDVRLLGRRQFRDGNVSNADVGKIFVHLRRTLDALHQRGVVVGDLNDANVLITLVPALNAWLIDADSMQFDGLPCPVGTEKFLDPLLYGVDLAAHPAFGTGSDNFAFAALLLASWLYVGPYGGRHPALHTWTRRAQARVSVLSKDVQYPKAAARPDILPDDLLQYFHEVFERDRRTPVPAEQIESLPWTRCHCGLEHARGACPLHAPTGKVRQAIAIHRSAKSTTVFRTRGRILIARVDDGGLRYLYEENGELRREGGALVAAGRAQTGTRFAIAGDDTWIGRGTELVRLRDGLAIEHTTTERFGELPMFASTSHRIVRINGRALVSDRGSHGQVLPGQTWFALGDDYGFGFYRVGRAIFHFLFELNSHHLLNATLPQPRGRIRDAHCVFDGDTVLFLLSEEVAGRVEHSMTLLRRRDGSIVGRLAGTADEVRALASLNGKIVRGGHVLSATDDGLLLLEVDPVTGELGESRLFADTEPFVEAGAQILPGPKGAIYHVTEREIRVIELA